jgi:hypothetical protein
MCPRHAASYEFQVMQIMRPFFFLVAWCINTYYLDIVMDHKYGCFLLAPEL